MIEALERHPLYAMLGIVSFASMVIILAIVSIPYNYLGIIIIPLYGFIGLHFKGKYVGLIDDWIRGYKL